MGTAEKGQKLVLASASPRRRDLLAQIGILPNTILRLSVDESPLGHETPREMATRLADLKGAAARAMPEAEGAFTLTADTVVGVGRRILGKPQDEAQARRFLELLSGRAHQVFTGVVLATPDGRVARRTVMTRVVFKRLSGAEIDAYIVSEEGEGKAGGYAIQGRAEAFVRTISGSYSNVVGLPLHETVNLLTGHGYQIY
ncbi:MAG: septum formation protein Maf [Alphaproteobacteria bacterium]|nr:MAG: septum formation protein Maf [Alphaproteobacteria bacterium]